METVKVNGEEYKVDLIADDKDYIVLKKVKKPKWRETVDNQNNWAETKNPIALVFHNVYCIGMDWDIDVYLARIIGIAENQGATAKGYHYPADFSAWEMMEYFCDKPDAVSHSTIPGKGNWQRLADYAATWLNYLLENK